ncbi:alpha/beta fold hydrolase [Paenibacillus sp. MBLB4367]|uniref:alpha/beta fold hydrolase n=1 Tax=Paenibacillus sp. MBLB4367 TaxID=3384767 RepID=UPI0039080C54
MQESFVRSIREEKGIRLKGIKRDCSFLWLSGWSAEKNVWEAQAKRWPDHEHVIIDFTDCHTASDVFASAEAAFLRLKRKPVVLIGWSLGAMVALELALRHPDEAIAVVAVGGTGAFVRSADCPYGWDRRIVDRMVKRLERDRLSATAHDTEDMLRDFDGRMFSHTESAAGFLDAWRDASNKRFVSPAALIAGLAYLSAFDIYPSLDRLRIPVHLLTGGEDVVCPPEGAEQLAGSMPYCEFTCWKHAGHLPFWTEPDRFYEWMRDRLC